MSELSKTCVFFVVAVGAIGLALFTRPTSEEYNVEALRGTPLVDTFPSDAPKRLEIVTRNAETGDLERFEVAEVNGTWTIPSKSGYPADATAQMAAAVEGVVGRDILDVIDAGSGDQAMYGVIDPSDSSADEGHGTHVKLYDGSDKELADLIIGKEVKDQPGQYYVRKAKQGVVYKAMLDLDKFTTDFENWIEKDLLKLSTFEVSKVGIDDYTIETELMLTQRGLEQGIKEDRRAKMELKYNEADSKWEPVTLETYNKAAGKYEEFALAEGETLNADALRELKNALDDLVIVDVEKKPGGLSADLRAGDDFIKSRETVESLARRGFLATRDPNNPEGDILLLSSEGEIVITQNDGVQYVLRFGDLQVDTTKQAEQSEADAEAEELAKAGDEGLNRYLFVMARFDESAIPKPVLEPLPELPAEDATAEEPAAEGEAAEGEEAADKPEGDEAKPSREEIEAERARIEQNNKRAEESYKEKIEAGKKRAEELNARFGDWYYVIPNEVFKKIHLGREELVTTAEGAPAANPNESVLGAPGAAIPGLPKLPAANTPPAAEPTPEAEPAATEPAAETPDTSETPEATEAAETDGAAETAEPAETEETTDANGAPETPEATETPAAEGETQPESQP
jgi:hypothetical protein